MKRVVTWLKNKFLSAEEDSIEGNKEELEIVPDHVAIIMDGNGRWAEEKGLARSAGHREGVNTLKQIVQAAQQLQVEYLTVYAFSTENWKRPESEVDFLMNLFEETFEREVDSFKEENIKVNVIGYKQRLPESVQEKIDLVREETRNNDGLTVNIALDYGGRMEIVNSVKELAQQIEAGKLKAEQITEAEIEKQLYTAQQPDPDLFIRPGGERRVSNFLLWQLAYAELYFTDVYWPDFTEENFLTALQEYQTRERRFGGL